MSSSFFSSHLCLAGCDRLITGGLLFLVLFTPLAFGSVHPWAYSLLEVVLFLLVLVWMGKLFFSSHDSVSGEHQRWIEASPTPPAWRFFLPLWLFIGVIVLQLLPMPPGLLRIVSPATYELYATSLSGWPEQIPYDEPASQTRPLPQTHAAQAVRSESLLPVPARFAAWRPLSLAPSLTRTDGLKFVAYFALLLLVVLYPFERSPQGRSDKHWYRSILLTVLVGGLLVGVLGIIQRFSWNGKILWFFVPYDWGAPRPDVLPHATGPFINHPPFANYLVLIFPLAVVGAWAGQFLMPLRGKERAFRLACGLAMVIMLLGILLSSSRGGWIGAGLGICLLFGLLFRVPANKRLAGVRLPHMSLRSAVIGCAFFALLVTFVVFALGSSGRQQLDVRLARTVMEGQNFGTRLAIWRDSLDMIQDFPLFGVGLGAWPDLFPRYRRAPWSDMFIREAHNDYVELLAETGCLGFGLLAWFFWRIGKELLQRFRTVAPETVPVFAALVAALGSMAFHEFFDFSLQIPANAFLFSLFLGLALRLAGAGCGLALDWSPRWGWSSGTIALGLITAALFQSSVPYPHRLETPTSQREATTLLASHPARAATHVALFLLQEDLPLSQRLQELEIALWLEPHNPRIRDLYAASLIQLGQQEAGLQHISQSVASAPYSSAHWYLGKRWRGRLSAQERQAIEEGFGRAITAGNRQAIDELGALYRALGYFAQRGRLYEEAAGNEKKSSTHLRYLLAAGRSYAKAGDYGQAEQLLHRAAEIAPNDPRPYRDLTTEVFVPRGDIDSAQAAVRTGIAHGADPFALYMALGEAASQARQGDVAEAAFQRALTHRPTAFEALFLLGRLYLAEQNFGSAALALRKAVESRPTSARGFYFLGEAEEARYRFFEAQKAYARAVELNPANHRFRQRYDALRGKVGSGDMVEKSGA